MKRIMGEEYVLNQMRELGLMPDEEDTELTDREENLGSAEAIRTGMEEAEARTQAGQSDRHTRSNGLGWHVRVQA